VHLIPRFGGKRLDTITTEDVQRLKSHLRERAPKTVNNVLTVLNVLLNAEGNRASAGPGGLKLRVRTSMIRLSSRTDEDRSDILSIALFPRNPTAGSRREPSRVRRA
jgi:hypothetical protein